MSDNNRGGSHGAMDQFVEHPLYVTSMGEMSKIYCHEKYEIGLVNEKMLQVMAI